MEIEKIKNYWLITANEDFKVMHHLFEKKDYGYALFFGHLVIEKTLKAFYCSVNKMHAPYKHNLVMLAKESNLIFSNEQVQNLEVINRFNIEARYPDIKLSFYKLCTKEFSEKYLKIIEELRTWLLKKI